jgi:hypothetical protein
MIASIKTRLPILMAIAALGLPLTPGHAAGPAPAPKDAGIDQLDCRTLLRLGGDERAYTLLYFHGFVSGRQNQMRLEVPEMAAVTDKVVDHCIEKPGDKLLPVFEKYRKAK